MKKLNLIRVETSEQGLLGVLLIDGVLEFVTLQPDSTDKHFCIPAGHYRCKRFHGTKWPDTFEIIVPGHTALLFHILNLEDESEGCIGLGLKTGYINGKRAILESGTAFGQFMKIMGDDQDCILIIEDCIR
jgi:hypothetical protein